MCGGPLRCGLLSVQVSPADDGNTTSVLRRLSGVGLSVSHLYAAAANVRKGSLYVVPNVVHFIWFADNATKPLTFINYVSVVSAHRIQRPDSIWLHCNYLPAGEWWEQLWRQVNAHLSHISAVLYQQQQKPQHSSLSAATQYS